MTDGTSTTLETYTVTVTQKNDEPTLTATALRVHLPRVVLTSHFTLVPMRQILTQL